MKMKHEQPKVEDYDSESANWSTTTNRKRGLRNQEKALDAEQPPTKASRKDTDEDQEDELVELDDEGLEEAEDNEGEYDEEEYDDGDEDEEENEVEDENENEGEDEEEGEEEGEEEKGPIDELKAHKIVEEFGRVPLEGTSIAEEPLEASPEIVLAIAIDAMIKSRPISHELSQSTVRKLIDAGYHDIQKLANSSWEERTMVLKDGGYNRYREQGATNLGNLAEFVGEKYDGDLNVLLKQADNDREKARGLIKEVKGLGELAADLFFNSVQSVWPSMAPFIDARSAQTADEIGIGTDLDAIYAELKQDPLEMSKFANGLSMARLEHKQAHNYF